MNCKSARLLCPWNSSGKNNRVGSHSLLQGIVPNEGSNLGRLHCRQILYHLSHQGSPYRLKCVSSSVVTNSLGPHGLHNQLASLSTEFSRQEHWRGLPFSSPEDLPNPGIKPRSPALQADSLPFELQGQRVIQTKLPIYLLS